MGKCASVLVVKPKTATINDYVTCNGKLEEKQRKEFYVSACEVEKVNFKVGDKVSFGDVLITVKKADSTNTAATKDGIEDFSADTDLSKILPNLDQSALNIITAPKSNIETTANEQELTAPFDGTITEMNCVEGQSFNSAKAIIVISDLSSMHIKTTINEALISKVKLGQKAIISGNGFKNTEYFGLVESISPIAKQSLGAGLTETVVEAIIGKHQNFDKLKGKCFGGAL
jgi:multidrug efflux pump subunit AcrA (membrane-fusion protein)